MEDGKPSEMGPSTTAAAATASSDKSGYVITDCTILDGLKQSKYSQCAGAISNLNQNFHSPNCLF